MWNGNEATAMNGVDFTAGVLPERALFSVEGPDAGSFLDNLVTADLDGLADGEARYAALLTPQGKMLFDFFVVKQPDHYVIDCSAAQRAKLVKRLGFYKLRAKVTVAPLEDDVVASPVRPNMPLAWRDPRSAVSGWRCAAPQGVLPVSPDYHAARIALGIADTDADLGSGEFFPHEANLDQLGGVSFTKGCYVGQEVVSRMEHRGTARNRILPVTLDGDASPKGSDIRAGDKQIGTLLSSSGNRALALLRLDRLADSTEPLLTEGVSLHVLKPRFARYDVPRAEGDA